MQGERFINVRKLAAFDLYFRPPRRILFEFGFAVFGFGALGVIATVLGAAKSTTAFAIGVYLVLLAVDYAPLFAYSVFITRRKSVKAELATELSNLEEAKKKYGVQQTLLLVPLFIPLLALRQEVRGRRSSGASA